jgi:aminopeptidase YwaD
MMLMNKPFAKRIILSCALVVASTWLTVAVIRSKRSPDGHEKPVISSSELARHIQYLASDELAGRLAGTAGAEKAAAYISREFQKQGLTPANGKTSSLQPFTFVAGIDLGASNRLTVGTESFELKKDFMPTSFSLTGDFQGTAIFAGHGISAPALNYDDYQNLDVKDRFVFVLRYGPEGNNPHGQFQRQHALRYKALTAREKGARAIVFIDDEEQFSKSTLSRLRYDAEFADSGIAALAISLPKAREIFSRSGLDLDTLQKEIAKSKKPVVRDLQPIQLAFHCELRKVVRNTANVVGILEGSDPVLKNESIVIGAHYDHIGLGELGSLAEGRGQQIHNGADDNASGTAGMLELARVLAGQRAILQRSLVFAGFSAEEEGLLGSKHYVATPAFPLDKTVAMINMDMIGRMKDNRVIVGGSGSSPLWKDLLPRLKPNGLELKFQDDGYGPSDHASFYAKDIPVLFFFTGVHQDYHRPSDDSDKINLAGANQVLELVLGTAQALSQQQLRPQFTKAKESSEPRGRGEFRVYLGTIPDYGEDVEGVKLSGVREGSPAAKAGIKGGDIIVECAGKQIKNVYDYTYVLGDRKPGDVVEIAVLRDNERVKMHVTLEERK